MVWDRPALQLPVPPREPPPDWVGDQANKDDPPVKRGSLVFDRRSGWDDEEPEDDREDDR